MIRPFQSQDAPACTAILHACILEDSALSLPLREKLLELETTAAMLERARLYYLVVDESAGGIIGVGGLDLNEIRILFVSPSHRHGGIGRALVAHLEAMVPPAFFKDIFVYSTPGSTGFYRTLGFREHGPAVFDIRGIPMETVFMTRLIR